MKTLISFFTSSIGKKWIVAVTGVILVAFVVGHLIGNLQVFLGQDALNSYAEKLHDLGKALWVIRLGLLAVIVLHIVTTILLAMENKAARPEKYAVNATVRPSTAAKTMLLSGLTVLAFIIYHLLHYTVRAFNPAWRSGNWTDAAGRFDVYDMMIIGFQNPLISAFYIVAVGLLCLHMSHGIQSFLQTLGGRTRKLAEPISKASPIFAGLIFLGYTSIPVAVLLNILKPISHQ